MQVKYPHYRKGHWHFYKVIDEDNCIEVYKSTEYLNQFRIQRTIGRLAYLPNINDCSEAEFLEAYYDVRNKLDNLSLIKL